MKWFVRSAFGAAMLGYLIWGYMVLCTRTIRWRVEGLEQAKSDWEAHGGLIVTAWHSTILTLPTAWTKYMRHWRDRPLQSAMLISLSADGEPVAKAIQHLGLESIRGSSTYKRKRKNKGGTQAFLEATTHLKAGGALCITPDGPRGPRQRVGAGPILLAQRSGAALLPYALATSPSKRLRTWDRFQIPLPFTRGAIVFAKAIRADADRSMETIRIELEKNLNHATRRAEALCGARHIVPAEPNGDRSKPATMDVA